MKEKIATLVASLFDVNASVELTRPDPTFGDYASNIALQLAKPLGRNPRDIAEQIAEALRESGEYKEVTVAGPGFINIRLNDAGQLRLIQQEPERFRAGEVIVIETNNPNPFKPMHIGHAYNAILADTMANLLAISAARVKRVSYHGDVGAHVGKSMWALLRFCE